MAPIIHKTLTLYFHPISQPSRAVHAAILLGKVEFTPKVIDMMAGEQKTPEFTLINPAQKLPAITDGDFKLYEGNAILKYLSSTRPTMKSLYPSDPKQKAQVDSYLYWHHTGTRKIITFLSDFFFAVKFFGKEAPPNRDERMKVVEEQLAFIENFFLGGQKKFKYIGNHPVLTIADLAAHAEISSLLFINYDFSKYPALQAWYENISKLPEVKESYKIHNGMVKDANPELNEFNRRVI